MTRAVVTLSEDITPLMPALNGVIEGCGYNAEAGIMGFRYLNMGVIIEPRRIVVNNAEETATVEGVLDWLRGRAIEAATKRSEAG